MSKRVRIWNSELAYRIDSQLTSQWDRSIFRNLLTQNELDESQLRSLLRLWRTQSNGKSLCEFLIDAGILFVEMRKPQTFGVSTFDSENEELLVSLTPRAQVELACVSSLKVLASCMHGILAKMFDNSFGTWKIGLTQTIQKYFRAKSTPIVKPKISEEPCNPAFKLHEKGTCPQPILETAEEFDPYATVY